MMSISIENMYYFVFENDDTIKENIASSIQLGSKGSGMSLCEAKSFSNIPSSNLPSFQKHIEWKGFINLYTFFDGMVTDAMTCAVMLYINHERG